MSESQGSEVDQRSNRDVLRLGWDAAQLVARRVPILLAARWWKRRDEFTAQARLQELGKAAIGPTFNDTDLTELQGEARTAQREVERLTAEIAEIEGAAMPEDPQQRSREEIRRKGQTSGPREELNQRRADASRRFVRLGERVVERSPNHPALMDALEGWRSWRMEQTRREARDRELAESWSALPRGSRGIGIGIHATGLLLIIVIGWALLASEKGPLQVDPPVVENTSEMGRDIPGSESSENAEEPGEATRGGADYPQGSEPADPIKQRGGTLPQELKTAARRYTGTIVSSTDRHVHRFQVAGVFAPIDLLEGVRHLGGQRVEGWERADPDAKELPLEFQFPDTPDCLVYISFDLFDVGQGNPIRLNGKPFGYLPAQGDQAFKPLTIAVPRQLLRAGKNELIVSTASSEGNHDDLMIRNVRVLPGRTLFRVELSRVPGVNTRLECFSVSEDGERLSQFKLDNVKEAGEEIHPNWAARPGAYELEVTGDGANPDVEYVISVEATGFLTARDEREPNDVVQSATPLRLGQTFRGYVARYDDKDSFVFALDDKSFLVADVDGVPEVDLALSLWDKDHKLIKKTDVGAMGDGERTDMLEIEKGSYYLEVSSSSGANVYHPYRLVLRSVPARRGYASEPNDNASQAVPVALGSTVRGTLSPPNEQDWFSFTIDKPAEETADPRRLVRFRVTPLDGIQLEATLDGSSYWLPPGGIGAEYKVTNWLVGPGEHKIAIRGQQQGRIDVGQEYRLRVEILEKPDDGYSVGNNSPKTRLPRTPRDVFRSALYPWEESDFYELKIEDDDIVYRLREDRPFLSRLWVDILDPEDLDAGRNVPPLKRIGPPTLENWTPRKGTYVLRVSRRDSADRHVDYAFRILEDRVWNSNEEREFNDSRESASRLELGGSTTGWFSPHSAAGYDQDWYRMEVTKESAESSYLVELQPESGYLDVGLKIVKVIDGEEKVEIPQNAQTTGAERIENWSPKPGTYYLLCYTNNSTQRNEPYTLRWEKSGSRAAASEFEPNNDPSNATALRLDRESLGSLDSKQDVDVFRVDGTSEPLVVWFRLQGADKLHKVDILDTAGKVISPQQTTYGGTLDFQNYVLHPNSAFYVRVSTDGYHYTRNRRKYSIVAMKREKWDATLEAEPNAASHNGAATKIEPGVAIRGAVRPEGDVDQFSWEVADDGRLYRLVVEPPEGQRLEAKIELTPASGQSWTFGETKVQGVPWEISNFQPGPGRVLLTLTSNYQKVGKPYTIRVEPLDQPVSGTDVEPNDIEPKVELSAGQVFQGGFHFPGDRDNYSLEADGQAVYDLALRALGKKPTKAKILRKENENWVQVKEYFARSGEEQIVHHWRPPAGTYRVNLYSDYGDADYALRLVPSTLEGTRDFEPNDRPVDGAPIDLGAKVRGMVDVPGDLDYYRLEVDASEGQVVEVVWKAPANTSIAWSYWHEVNRAEPNSGNIPPGQTLAINNVWLPLGVHYFGVARNDQPAEYEFQVHARSFEPGRGYQTWGSARGSQPFPESGVLRGRLIPFTDDSDAYEFKLAEPSAVDVHLSAIKGTKTALTILDAQGKEVYASDMGGTGSAETLYHPYLNAGRYRIQVRALDVKPDARDYELSLRTGQPGYVFPPAGKPQGRNVAWSAYGGSIVRTTSQYDEQWSAAHLLDGDTSTNGWCSTDMSTPQEIVIGFHANSVMMIDRVSINPRTPQDPKCWAKEVDILVTDKLNAGDDDWTSAGQLVLGQESRYYHLDFAEPRKAARVMMRIRSNHGDARYIQMGEVQIREALPPGESTLREKFAMPLHNSGFPGGFNLLLSRFGSKVASVTSEYDESWKAENLLDGIVVASPGWLSEAKKGPFEVVLEAPQNIRFDWLLFDPRIADPGSNWNNRVKDIEVWTSRTSATDGFERIISLRLDKSGAVKVCRLPRPTIARWIKLRTLSNHGGQYHFLGEVMAVPDPKALEVSLKQKAYGDGPSPVPGTIELERFDTAIYEFKMTHPEASPASQALTLAVDASEGATFVDQTPKNEGTSKLRDTPVDIQSHESASGNTLLSQTNAGEWLEYTVEVARAGKYTIEVLVAHAGLGGAFHLEFDGQDKTGPIIIPDTGGWYTWQTIKKQGVELEAGRQVLRVVMDRDSESSGYVGHFDLIRFVTEE